MSFKDHIDVMFAKSMSMLGFIKRLSGEFRNPYTFVLYVSLVRSKLEYACCVWQPFYAVHIARIERIQENFIKYALRRLGWDQNRELPSYKDRCALIHLDTLRNRRETARIMFVFDLLSNRIVSSRLLSDVCLRVPFYLTRRQEFLFIENHRTNYGTYEPINAAVLCFNEVAGLFDFNLSRNQFLKNVKTAL
jgi:hypothetical protein